ncbi:MAG TPA: hypothetical protein VK444_00250 [Methanobacteriaceae archaeon]|nr:hypothetical protein [Methanobacteriaceae archaeon]
MNEWDKNLRWHLFEDSAENLKEELGEEASKNFFNNIENLNNSYNRFKIPIKFLELAKRVHYSFNSVKSNKNNRKTVIFQDVLSKRYPSIVSSVSKLYNPVLIGETLFSLFNPSRTFYQPVYFPIYSIYMDIYSGILDNNEMLLQKALDDLMQTFKDLNPDLIVLNQDAFPESRAVIMVAKKMGIPTIEIQHGTYQPGFISTGRYVDEVFVWGEYFRKLYYDEKIRKPGEVKILGYPYELETMTKKSQEKIVLYYLGQNFEAVDSNLLDVKIKTVNFLQKLCEDLGFGFVYRFHPSDQLDLLRSNIPGIEFTPQGETLKESFKKGDIFISFNSTSLIEASLRSKLCIQLRNYDLPADNFEKLGICAKTVKTLEELELFIREISKIENFCDSFGSVDRNYIEVPTPNPGARFLELIDDLI